MKEIPPREKTSATPRIFYGWIVVLGIGIVLTMASGLAFYNLSVLLQAFVAERGFPVALVSGGTAAFFVASGVAGVTCGHLIDRIDARIIIIVSAIACALTLASVGLVSSIWELYAFHIVFGLTYGGCSLVPCMTILARWFDTRRSLALSVASSGLSLGGILITPPTAHLIHEIGLAAAAPWLGAVFFAGVVPVTAFLIRSSPESMGLAPDGVARPAGSPITTERIGTAYEAARRSRFFIAVTITYIFALGAQVGALAHLYRLVSVRGGLGTASAAVAALATTSILGRLGGAWVLLKVPSRIFTASAITFQVLSLMFLAVAEGEIALIAGAALFGLSVGNLLMMHALLLAEAFGTRDYGKIYSTSQFLSITGVAGGPILMGIAYDLSGGYFVPYLVAATSSLCGLVLLVAAGPTPRPGHG